MLTTPPALISRLRRRMAGAVWLFAVLILLKGAIATACSTDGLAGADVPAATVVTSAETAVDVGPFDDADGPCWHAGAGGCHCSCVHVTPIVPDSPHLRAPAHDGTRFAPARAIVRVAPRDDHLRPPIA